MTTVIDKPDAIRCAQLLAAKKAIKLEKAGMRHSSGKSIKAAWARHFQMPARSTHDAVIARIDAELNAGMQATVPTTPTLQ
jgi:hypothetical protein